MIDPDKLLAEIEAFLIERGISASAFGVAAVHDAKLVKRLREGANMTTGVLRRARAHLDRERQRSPVTEPPPLQHCEAA